MSVLLGCIADDLTGATDLASTLAAAGMPTIQLNGVPPSDLELGSLTAAVVIALRTRSVWSSVAISESLAALRFLRRAGARQIYFKYCSTFDSTDDGNIGPVADALMDSLDANFTVVCPAFPRNGRTVRDGNLYVGDQLLSDSPMRHHPVTPMTDSNLVRVLGRQTQRRVGLVALPFVRADVRGVADELNALRSRGDAYAVVDAVSDDDLFQIAAACVDLPLLTGASGLAGGLPQALAQRGRLELHSATAGLDPVPGQSAVLAGSCSEATRRQVSHWLNHSPAVQLDPRVEHDPTRLAARALAEAERLGGTGPVLYYSSADPQAVGEAQQTLGKDLSHAVVEEAFALLARALVARGVRRLVVAGGETSGAVVNALGIVALRIGPEIDIGVPWTISLQEPRIALALKSGNFGGPDFFRKALELLP